MRLSDLNPRFYTDSPTRSGAGICFDCPTCPTSPHRCCVPFTNPLDGGPNTHEQGKGWERTGETFDTLTLTPSIRIGDNHCHIHITNGEIIPA